ncbi:1-(5-phosphoribosyl)-5-[(5-phosphoribosylamino)methylideneamino]imidazole-4-carboxamide isomerase [Ornithinimicrobium cryptoxanthini]|uniref:1-(5-phosphoribosyl)-5-[(5-phosphoribosylamino)methylideneamino] imidazole-4-carboxamide isomerase n=1 Tax=Ornithinimicrobium cryptoxanthini TaxID=2934161 RepID=A0ABY4YM66_9MICO|nr:1-(5-phosphoribosyl)-5-[(5-phosphoribosylamino)methylideneamino]imidazole-4-carboxamide isomerase [Ornithinimicrobium cryptoxanthini]USQ77891.1 1-(5-phosphoribosyl)-5-[(5-phosphoribosylamino)methylideneamino]imidazole-4-carboxamide isomerase [Ornithinimicrobium cryptoxanthini]
MTDFTIYPAIDVREGRVVRLLKGDYNKETRYPDDPLTVAREYAEGGATWLHLVDLDAARAGDYTLVPLLRQIVAETGLSVQTGGGVRGKEDVAEVLEAGASRVVLGSLAVREPETVASWIEEFGPERITVAFDTRAGEDGSWVLPTSGWTADSETDLAALLSHYARSGLAHALCTDIGRDGTLSGPNLNLYTFLTRAVPDVAVQASGGARHAADVRSVRKVGCAGVILGKALLEDKLTITEAIAEERQ